MLTRTTSPGGSISAGEDLRVTGGSARSLALRIDHQPQRKTLRSGRRRRRHAVHGRQHAAMLERTGQRVRLANVAFELELHEAEQGDRDRRLALDVNAVLTDVA